MRKWCQPIAKYLYDTPGRTDHEQLNSVLQQLLIFKMFFQCSLLMVLSFNEQNRICYGVVHLIHTAWECVFRVNSIRNGLKHKLIWA